MRVGLIARTAALAGSVRAMLSDCGAKAISRSAGGSMASGRSSWFDRSMSGVACGATGLLSRLRGRLLWMAAGFEFFQHFAVESRDVGGLAASDQAVVHHDFLIHILAAGVVEVGLQRGPRRNGASFDGARLDQSPGAVADCCHRLAGVE